MSDLIATLTLAANLLNNTADTELVPLNLTARRIVLMQAIGTNDNASATAICAATGIDRSTASAMIKQLLKLGYLTRKRSPKDSRAYVVTVTDKGRDAMKAGIDIIVSLEKRVAKKLGRPATDAMHASLEAIARGDAMLEAAE